MSTLRKDGPEASDNLVESGQRLYDGHLKALLEPEHEGEFVAIEPESERYFLGPTDLAALRAKHMAAYRVGGYCEPRPAS